MRYLAKYGNDKLHEKKHITDSIFTERSKTTPFSEFWSIVRTYTILQRHSHPRPFLV